MTLKVIDIGTRNTCSELLDVVLMSPEVGLVLHDEMDKKFTWKHAVLTTEDAASLKEKSDFRVQPESAEFFGVDSGLEHLLQCGWQAIGNGAEMLCVKFIWNQQVILGSDVMHCSLKRRCANMAGIAYLSWWRAHTSMLLRPCGHQKRNQGLSFVPQVCMTGQEMSCQVIGSAKLLVAALAACGPFQSIVQISEKSITLAFTKSSSEIIIEWRRFTVKIWVKIRTTAIQDMVAYPRFSCELAHAVSAVEAW